jgi:hypothetical protein
MLAVGPVVVAIAAHAARRPPLDPADDARVQALAPARSAPAPLASDDADRDGIPDALERELAERFAPIVMLDRRDWTRPASIPWLLARADVVNEAPAPKLAAALSSPKARLPFSHAMRAGSDDPNDWTTYVHVYPRADGGINVQYWFLYAYNDGPAIFDHESDWEHVTVRLDRALSPMGVYFARHEDDHPGVYKSFGAVHRDGDHPIVLSASGTHASYVDRDDLAWFESAATCGPDQACGDRTWRTWQGGGLVNIGETRHPLAYPDVLAYEGRWGREGSIPGTSAPHGPMQHAGFCHAGFVTCAEPPPSLAMAR